MKVRVGVVGCGWANSMHCLNLQANSDVELVGFCDIVPERAEEFAEKFGGRTYSDWESMLKSERVGAVYVAIPPFAHAQEEALYSQKGLDLLVEKPIALELETARRINSLLKANGGIQSVGYHWRYLPAVQQARELLKDARVGSVDARWQVSFPATPWWRDKRKSGGIIIENLTHFFDLLRYLFGEVQRVYCNSALQLLTDIEDFRQEDVCLAILEFHNGALASVNANCCDRHHPLEQRIKVFADKMTLLLEEQRVEVWHDQKLAFAHENKVKEGLYEREDRVFIEAVKTRCAETIKSSYQDAIKTLQLTLAIEQSAKEHVPIEL